MKYLNNNDWLQSQLLDMQISSLHIKKTLTEVINGILRSNITLLIQHHTNGGGKGREEKDIISLIIHGMDQQSSR